MMMYLQKQAKYTATVQSQSKQIGNRIHTHNVSDTHYNFSIFADLIRYGCKQPISMNKHKPSENPTITSKFLKALININVHPKSLG